VVKQVKNAKQVFLKSLRDYTQLQARFCSGDLQIELLPCFDIRLALRPHLLSVHFKQYPAFAFFGNGGLHYLIWLQIVLHGVSTFL
jgi:hypothetical protein